MGTLHVHEAQSKHAPSWSLELPHFVFKARQHSDGVLDILLSLLPHVEDRAIFACTKDVLMQRALTALALRPQAGI